MLGHVTHVTVYVNDQDAALDFYRDKLGFELVTDSDMQPGMRWLTVRPPGGQAQIVLFKAFDGPMGKKEAGGWTGMVLHCENRDAAHAELLARGVKIAQEPRDLPWGRDFSFEDPDGNMFNVVEPVRH
ncbi:VOC family protein [bacterium]|nr:VOC family protein [bacterium]